MDMQPTLSDWEDFPKLCHGEASFLDIIGHVFVDGNPRNEMG